MNIERLKELLHYNPVTGVFTWKVSRGNRKVGSIAGRTFKGDYIQIKLDGKLYLAHRLAWLYMTGSWPSAEVDHRYLDRSDNAWDNIRLAAPSQNRCNKRAQSNNSLGVKGVYKDQGKYRACVTFEGKHTYLGCFTTLEEARIAYTKEVEKLHGEFARTE